MLFEADIYGDPNGIIVVPWFWCPELSLRDKEEKNRDLYRGWLDRGFMRTTEGSATDFAAVRRDIMAILKDFDLVDIGMDMRFGVETAQYLMAEYGNDRVTQIDQNMANMTPPCQDLETRIKFKTIYHGDNPILRWNAGNVMLKTSGDLRRPMKEKENSPKKIDGIAALAGAGGAS